VRWARVVAVVRRDLTVALGSKAVVLPAVIVSLVLLVLLPAGIGLAPRWLPDGDLSDVEPLLEALPPERLAALPEDPAMAAAVVTLTLLLLPMVLLVPVMVATVLAADGVAGEQERRTLEGLLLTPVSDRELATAKLLAAWLPAVVLGTVGAGLYAGVVHLTLGRPLGEVLLPDAAFLVLVLVTSPTFAAATLGAVMLVSVRSSSTQEAYQLGGLVVLPVVALTVAQAIGALVLSPVALAVAGLVAAVLAVVLLRAATRALARPSLGPRLG
jgi:ABC-2 type transport system permease protein